MRGDPGNVFGSFGVLKCQQFGQRSLCDLSSLSLVFQTNPSKGEGPEGWGSFRCPNMYIYIYNIEALPFFSRIPSNGSVRIVPLVALVRIRRCGHGRTVGQSDS